MSSAIFYRKLQQKLELAVSRVSFQTSFDSKQPTLEPKLVLALSETKRLFRLFRLYTETESFDVSIEPKQTEDQTKQFDREHILLFFTNLGFFRFFLFGFTKQTETNTKQILLCLFWFEPKFCLFVSRTP